MGEDARRSAQDVALAASANLLHDALEVFLVAIAEHLDVPVDRRSDFDKYFVKIDERLQTLALPIQKLPFRNRLMKLSDIRRLAKHQGVKPDRDAMNSGALVAKEFLETCSDQIFARPYWSINPLDGLDEGKDKGFLTKASEEFDADKFYECLVECRKWIYSTFEKGYSLEPLQLGDGAIIYGDIFFNRAAYYKQNEEWVEKNVKTPFDYIQLDHAKNESELLADGIDPQIFWNIWRLTPRVFRPRNSEEWLQEYKPEIAESAEIGKSASYVLEQTVNLALTKQRRRNEIWQHAPVRRTIELKSEGTNVYERATKNSKVVAKTPPGITQFDVRSGTPSLDGSGYFWEILHFGDSHPTDILKGYISGYISNEDLVWDQPTSSTPPPRA
jgi:hypothetical protein